MSMKMTRCRSRRHGIGVDESLVLDDLAVLAGEPHPHRAVRRLHLHAHQTRAADAHVHLRDGDGGAFGPYHSLKSSGSVHSCQMRFTGASKLRSITTRPGNRCCRSSPSPVLRASELCEVVVHPVEAGLPDGPVLLGQVETCSSGARRGRTVGTGLVDPV